MIINSIISSSTAGQHCIETNGNTAKIYNSILISGSGGNSVYSSDAHTAKIANCIMKTAINGNITNLIDTPYNVVDSDISL